MLVAFVGVVAGFGLVASWLEREADRVSDVDSVRPSQRRARVHEVTHGDRIDDY